MIIASSPNDALRVIAPPQSANVSLALCRLGKLFKDSLFGIFVSLFAAVAVFADDLPQDWVPEIISLPGDAEITMDRAIGSSIRMFSFSTQDDIKVLFEKWAEALDEDGYTIRPQPTELEEAAIEFSGRDILNAKIATDAAGGDGRAVVTFDATLR